MGVIMKPKNEVSVDRGGPSASSLRSRVLLGLLLASVAFCWSADLAHTQVAGSGPGGACTDPKCNPVPPVENPTVAAAGGYQYQTSFYNFSQPLKKFVDALEIPPIAVPDTTKFANADYYELSVVDYTKQMHHDLPNKTRLRGYMQTNVAGTCPTPGTAETPPDPAAVPNYPGFSQLTNPACPAYMGPVIVAHQDKPVRVKMTNALGTNQYFLPVDETIMGAGMGPPLHADGTYCTVVDPDPACATTGKYSQNRALFHLHGGATPWISDGTPHQWTTPVNDPSPYKKGVSAQPVPDMPAGDGELTYYYTNQQSGRMMWYHDHSYGLTRLNVYAGEAAGFLLTDPQQENLISNHLLPQGATRYGTPLIIQDKSFVQAAATPPAAAQPGTAFLDPLWCKAVTTCNATAPQAGDLWFPHVYIPNQYPLNPTLTGTGQNPVGRWDYAPAVVPPGFVFGQSLPTLSAVPEAFVDTMVVNGKAFPSYKVGQKAYRFQILNASNDRMLNLQLYYAVGRTDGSVSSPRGIPCMSAATKPADCTEVQMVPAHGQGYAMSLSNGTKSVPTTVYVPYDNRPGGVPDPRYQGPPFIVIGNDGGLLPNPVVLNHVPVDFEYDRRQLTTLNIRSVPVSGSPQCPVPGCNYPNPGYTLMVGPAERTDIIIDFSGVNDGATLVLYNDAAAPMPAFDNRYDFFTNGPDQTMNGGAPPTQKGYGPNTRTIMQFQVTKTLNTVPNGAKDPTYSVTALGGALAAAYNVSHAGGTISSDPNPPSLTGQIATPGYVYRLTPDNGTLFGTTTPVFGECVNATNGGNSFCGTTGLCDVSRPGCDPKNSVVEFPPCRIVSGVDAQGFPNYTNDPGYRRTCGFPVKLKAIVEDFDTYGRMNALLGVEQSAFNAALGQNTFGYPYVEPATNQLDVVTGPATEMFNGCDPYWVNKNGSCVPETQVWGLVHNGVDSHAIHVHLLNAQVINRVDWAGVIKSPDANELGWKETIRVHPLENVVLLVRPKAPSLPFGIPRSRRPYDVTAALGTTDPANPAALFPFFTQTVVNEMGDFGWEYVWHCHLLGHEENDMMRPLVMQAGGPGSPFPTNN